MPELTRITCEIDKALVGKTIAYSMIVLSDLDNGVAQRFTDDTFVYGTLVRSKDGDGFRYDWTADVTGDMLRAMGATGEQAKAWDRNRLTEEIEQATLKLGSLKMRLAEIEEG